MKILLVLGLFLFVALSGHAVLGARGGWLTEFSTEEERLKQDALVEKAYADGKAWEKRLNASLNSIKQKCASASRNNGNVPTGRIISLNMQESDGVQEFNEEILNPITNKVEEIQYSIDTKDPNAKPVCGKPV